jgi:hypothetical protein
MEATENGKESPHSAHANGMKGHECLYNIQHKDYDNNLVKDSSWKEIAGELHAQDKELSRGTQHCQRMAG